MTFGFDYEFGGRTALITDLYLEPSFRGLGLGRKTLRYLESFCRKSGIPALELQVEQKNRRALRLYRTFGFEALPRIPMSKRLKK
jgi:ribosomal protein S18 acetylase RimI-like enzyme